MVKDESPNNALLMPSVERGRGYEVRILTERLTL